MFGADPGGPGALPVSLEAVEEAIRLNGAALETTLTAFRWGRAAAIDTLGGRLAGPAFRALRAARHLRGTPLDVFGAAGVRRVERELVGEYQRAVREACEVLGPDTVDLVVEVAGAADLVRGYEAVKLANVAWFRERVGELLART